MKPMVITVEYEFKKRGKKRLRSEVNVPSILEYSPLGFDIDEKSNNK